MEERFYNTQRCPHGNVIGFCEACSEERSSEALKGSRNTEIREIGNPFIRLAECAKKVVSHIKNSNYSSIIVSGGSREISKTLFEEAWVKMYPKQQCPPIYEINSEGNSILYKDISLSQPREISIQDWLLRNLPALIKEKDKKICFLDEYAESGEKTTLIKKNLKKIGFKHMEAALFASSIKADLDDEVFVASPEDSNTTNSLATLSAAVQGRDITPFSENKDPEVVKAQATINLEKIIANI